MVALEEGKAEAERKLNYCQNVFNALNDPEGKDCKICYDVIKESSMAILPCSHVFCYDCVTPYVEKSHSCPLCRHNVPNVPNVFRIRIKKPEQLSVKRETSDTSKYSSKLMSLYRYITKLLETDKNARIILFLQFKDLADFMARSFKELKFECACVTRLFSNVKMLLTSLIVLRTLGWEAEATHVILLHPFFTVKGEAIDLAYEKQGISRAYCFGLKHPLKIVRFAVRGTIE